MNRLKTDRLKIYRLVLIIVLIINILFLGYYYLYRVTSAIPDSIKVYVGDKSSFDFDMPATADVDCGKEVLSISNASTVDKNKIHFSLAEPFTVEAGAKGQYEMSLKLFGVLDLKKVSLDVIDSAYLTPSGSAIGIRLDTEGLLVLGTGSIKGADGLEYEPARQIIRTGDYIVGINGKKVGSIKKLQQLLKKCRKKEVVVTIRRNDVRSKVKLPIIKAEEGENKLGIWVRENTQGIGTMTYISDDGTYGALGHGITDSDTGVLMNLGKGSIYETEILRIIRGRGGIPGEIMGMILETPEKKIGSIDNNTILGISGKLNPDYTGDCIQKGNRMPVALRQDIKKGAAKIMCQLDEEIDEYDVDIVDVKTGSDDNKGLVIQITDEGLLEKTGGIIQGMSGSPIIQDGKLVGAVTHVFVNDPTKGYGIMIENML